VRFARRRALHGFRVRTVPNASSHMAPVLSFGGQFRPKAKNIRHPITCGARPQPTCCETHSGLLAHSSWVVAQWRPGPRPSQERQTVWSQVIAGVKPRKAVRHITHRSQQQHLLRTYLASTDISRVPSVWAPCCSVEVTLLFVLLPQTPSHLPGHSHPPTPFSAPFPVIGCPRRTETCRTSSTLYD